MKQTLQEKVFSAQETAKCGLTKTLMALYSGAFPKEILIFSVWAGILGYHLIRYNQFERVYLPCVSEGHTTGTVRKCPT